MAAPVAEWTRSVGLFGLLARSIFPDKCSICRHPRCHVSSRVASISGCALTPRPAASLACPSVLRLHTGMSRRPAACTAPRPPLLPPPPSRRSTRVRPPTPLASCAAGWLFTYYNTKKTDERKAQIERINDQVRLLYGPLLACVHASRSAYSAMVRQVGPAVYGWVYVE